MRISDWSSDVCSSDLGGGAGDVVGHVRLSGENYSSLLQRSTGNIQAIFAVQPTSGICKVARMELGARIAHYRSQAGLNQSELARAMKPAVTPQTVQAWEKGGGIRPSKFESLASALGISLGTLLLGEDRKSTRLNSSH